MPEDTVDESLRQDYRWFENGISVKKAVDLLVVLCLFFSRVWTATVAVFFLNIYRILFVLTVARWVQLVFDDNFSSV